jgi:hypothetical protein
MKVLFLLPSQSLIDGGVEPSMLIFRLRWSALQLLC